MLRENGVMAEAVSGGTKTAERKKILKDYAEKKIQVLCACDLLNNGWNSPITIVYGKTYNVKDYLYAAVRQRNEDTSGQRFSDGI